MACPEIGNVGNLFEKWLRELGLCKQFKLAGEITLAPEAYKAALYLKRRIKSLGIERAFCAEAEALCYSGPRDEMRKIKYTPNSPMLLVGSRVNHKKAKYFAENYGYFLIDQTAIGHVVDYYERKATKDEKIKKLSLFDSLKKSAWAKELLKADFTEKEIEQNEKFIQSQIDAVMGFVSAAFILSSQGNVDTLVCGAGTQKVFYLFELPAIMANDKITSINGVPKEKFAKIYNSGAKDAVYQTYRAICESEIARLGELAHKKGKRSAEWRIWKEQRNFFRIDNKQRDVINVHKNIDALGKGKQSELISVFKNILAQKELVQPPANSNTPAVRLESCELG